MKRRRESDVPDTRMIKRIRAKKREMQAQHDAHCAKIIDRVSTLLLPAISLATQHALDWPDVMDTMRLIVECWDNTHRMKATMDKEYDEGMQRLAKIVNDAPLPKKK
jgi:hypothetical protein